MTGGHHPGRKRFSLLLGLGLVFIGVVVFFIVLRILFEPALVGGNNMVMLVIPLAIVGCITPLYFGIRILIRRAQHAGR